MSSERQQYDHQAVDGIERALLELRSLDEHHVEARTPVDAAALLQQTPGAEGGGSGFHVLRWYKVAAVIALAAVSWSVMFSYELSSIRSKAGLSQTILADHTPSGEPTVPLPQEGGCDGSFIGCFTGPSDAMASSCAPHDYDGDGDVDLADFMRFQLDCTGPA